MNTKLKKLKVACLLLLHILVFNVSGIAQTESFVPINGMTIGPDYIVFEAEATELPLGKWQIITPEDSRCNDNGTVPPINNTHLEFTGNNHNLGPATSPHEYSFVCPKTGTYRLGGRLYQRLEGQPSDKCNDVYIRMEGNFTSANTIPTSVLKHDQKFFGRGVNKWDSFYSIDSESNGQAPVLYNLIEGEIYTLTVSGRAQRTNVDYWIIYKTTLPYKLESNKDIAAFNDEKYLPKVTPEIWTIQHPVIWATEDEKPQILEKIENFDWAKSIVNQMHNYVDSKLATHQSNPNAILNTIPEFPANDGNSEATASPLARDHKKVLTVASYSGMLYYLTEDEKYAQFAADILAYYIDVIVARTPQTTTISGNYFYDPRTTYNHFAVAYDFIFNFIKQPGSTAYNKASGTYVAFDNEKAQKAITNIIGNALAEYGSADTHGKFISNHPVLTAPGALFPILCIEDDIERERLFDVFWNKGTNRQNSFQNTILPMFGEQGIWTESTSYSFMPNISLIPNIVDRIKPEMNVAASNQNIFDGNFIFSNLRNPDRRFVRYGDSKRNSDGTDKNYRYALDIAERRGFNELKEKAQVALKQYNAANGGYKPQLSSGTFDNYDPLELFWGHPLPETEIGDIDYKPTVIVKHAGVALQRNYVENANTTFGLSGIIGGAHYVHSHGTGIAIELYGAGYVMGPNGGLPGSVADRNLPVHTNYFRLYAGNNTVIVNGMSHGKQPACII